MKIDQLLPSKHQALPELAFMTHDPWKQINLYKQSGVQDFTLVAQMAFLALYNCQLTMQ